jgi:hypothetical protein
VGREHDAECTITDWQRGHIAIDQRRVIGRAKHA